MWEFFRVFLHSTQLGDVFLNRGFLSFLFITIIRLSITIIRFKKTLFAKCCLKGFWQYVIYRTNYAITSYDWLYTLSKRIQLCCNTDFGCHGLWSGTYVVFWLSWLRSGTLRVIIVVVVRIHYPIVMMIMIMMWL